MNELIEQPLHIEEIASISTGFLREKPVFEESPVSEGDMELINRFAPGQLESTQVYTRSMYLCSSQPCISDGCQFTRTALEEIAERVAGLSVLTGHDRSSLPLARFYKAVVVPRGDNDRGEPVFFVRAWFYWLRNTTGAKDLLLNIDGGIYREVSLAWRYDSWRCSICQASNSVCGHRVGTVYDGKQCFRLIDRITEVLEGSLVYKSADRNTYLMGSRALEMQPESEPLLLVGARDDPLFSLLERSGAILESHDFVDLQESLSQSVQVLWIRSETPAFCERMAEKLLLERGDCLAEIVSFQSGNEPAWGNLLHLTNAKTESLPIQSLNRMEEDHGAIRTI